MSERCAELDGRFCNGFRCPIHEPDEMVEVHIGQPPNDYAYLQERGTILTVAAPSAFIDLEDS